jgi:hypothetical protein
MAGHEQRLLHLFRLRDGLLDDLAEADRAFSELRMRVERMESDLRVGRPEAEEYRETKGRLLPRAEARVVALFRDLLKVEDKINLCKLSGESTPPADHGAARRNPRPPAGEPHGGDER